MMRSATLYSCKRSAEDEYLIQEDRLWNEIEFAKKAEVGQSLLMTPFGIAFRSRFLPAMRAPRLVLEKRHTIASRSADDGGNHRCSLGQERRRTVWFGNRV